MTQESNSATERWLANVGVTFETINLKLAAIDRNRSLRNQARVGAPLNDETVLVYVEAMKAGDEFPPIVACLSGGRVTVADGNHRCEAARLAGWDSIRAYLVTDPTPAQEARLLYEGNLRHGLPSTMTDRLHHAKHLVEAFQMTHEQAASTLGIPPGRLSAFMRRQEARSRLSRMRVKSSEAEAALDALSRVKPDAALIAAAALSLEVTATRLSDVVTQANRARSEREMVAIFEAASEMTRRERAASGNLPSRSREATPLQRISRVANVRSQVPTREQAASIPAELQPAARRSLVQLVEAIEAVIEVMRP